MEGQINSALRYLSEDDGGGVLPLTDDVVRQLGEKHPEAQRAKLGSLLFGPVEEIPDLVYQEINGELVREAALRTKGSGGPSGVDANGFKRILACKSFKRSSVNLCESIATLTRRLCTEFVDLFYHLPFFFFLPFIYLFTDLFVERACPQLAKANLGGPCLNKQITKQKNKKKMYI